MKILRRPYAVVVALMVSMALFAPACEALEAGFVSRDEALLNAQGIVREVDYAAQAVIIGGLSYHFAPDALVRIDGGPGAWSLLGEGMKVDFLYRDDSTFRRTIVELHTLPAEFPMDEH